MSTPYIGEIRMFAFGTRGAPNGWQACDGSLLPIAQYDALFALIGTTYGGDGQTTFGVPDLRGRVPVHQGQGPGLSNYVIGQRAGTETVTVLSTQMPAHTHTAVASTAAASTGSPGNTVLPGAVANQTMYVTDTTGGAPFTLAGSSVSNAGGSQPHENCMPTLTVQFCIATQGIFPSQA
jgi:microcystin-dependent protein